MSQSCALVSPHTLHEIVCAWFFSRRTRVREMANPSRQPLPNRNKASTNLSHIGMQCWELVAAHTWRVSYIIEILNRLLSPICSFRCLFPRNFLAIFVRGALLQSYYNLIVIWAVEGWTLYHYAMKFEKWNVDTIGFRRTFEAACLLKYHQYKTSKSAICKQHPPWNDFCGHGPLYKHIKDTVFLLLNFA